MNEHYKYRVQVNPLGNDNEEDWYTVNDSDDLETARRHYLLLHEAVDNVMVSVRLQEHEPGYRTIESE